MTNRPTDHGLMSEAAGEVKDDFGAETLEAVADKGYHAPEDMAQALENGIVPNVIQNDGASSRDVEYEYEEAEVTEGLRASRSAEDIRVCLHARVIPHCM